MGLGGGAEDEVGADNGEEEIGGPGGEQGREGIDVSQGTENSGDDPVGDGDCDGGGDADEASALAHEEGEGDGENGHDEGDDWVCDLAFKLDAETNGVEAGLAEVSDVGGELAVGHLLRLFLFLDEVTGLLVDIGEAGEGEGLIGGDGLPGESALPAVVEEPLVGGGIPADALGKDTSLEGEGLGIELEDGKAGEEVAVWVEGLVVEDPGG